MVIEFGKTYFAKRQAILQDPDLSPEGKKKALKQAFAAARTAYKEAITETDAKLKENNDKLAAFSTGTPPQKPLPQLKGTLKGEDYINDADKAVYKMLGAIGGLLAEQRAVDRMSAIAATVKNSGEMQKKIEQVIAMEPGGQGALLRALPAIQAAVDGKEQAERVSLGLWLDRQVKAAEAAETTPAIAEFFKNQEEERTALDRETPPLLTQKTTLEALWNQIQGTVELEDSYDDPDDAQSFFKNA